MTTGPTVSSYVPMEAVPAGRLAVSTRLADYMDLAKPRIAAMVLLTVTVGFTLGTGGIWHVAGLAGALQTLVLGFETLGDAYWTMSGLVVLMTLVGGMSTMFGPLLGAFIIVALENRLGDIGTALSSLTGIDWFNSLGESVTIVTGLIFIACVLLFRRGIVGEIVARVKPLRG